MRFSQTEMPVEPIAKVLKIPKALWDQFAGSDAPPGELAVAVGVSPTSSGWRTLTGSAVGYGVTAGSYNSAQIKLTDLGRAIVAPTEDGEDARALVEATMKPAIARQFYEKYNQRKLPNDEIGANVLVSLGVPKDRAQVAIQVLKENARTAGMVLDAPTGAVLTTAPRSAVAIQSTRTEATVELYPAADLDSAIDEEPKPSTVQQVLSAVAATERPVKVFLSHGKQKAVLEQLKEIVSLKELVPVISIERETTAKPVPDKVFDDMRSCFAGIIHVTGEEKFLDADGNTVYRINENVLIEIGAAIALYRKNVILLTEKGLQLPSNLQGLYRCEYEGKELTADAMLKLLKTIALFER
ncbi:MAG: nucleotide-binding protein [Candidatus Eremiobacteraeota bacterium]|nr:nucleotide-binding protein [Candidatus Eremiobacteraeota bacterium]